MGRATLIAVVLNCVIGSGIFGLPAQTIKLVGTASPLAVLIAGACIFTIVLCFAEVGSRYEEAGGPYLYAADAFGPAAGFQIGWLLIWTRVFSGAASLNLFVAYLGQLWPGLMQPLPRAIAMTLAVASVMAINLAGVRQAAWILNLFAVAKLAPLVLLIAVGAFFVDADVVATQAVASTDWTQALLFLVFAYGGFEASGIAGSEARNPRRDYAFAIIVAMLAITLLYCLTQWVVMGVLPHAAGRDAPIAAALGAVLGPGGLALGSVAVALSVYGWMMSFILLMPRIVYSMAQRRELPEVFGRVSPTRRIPHVAIVAIALVLLGFGLVSNFTQSALYAAIARLSVYIVCCLALLRLRRVKREPAGFTLFGGVPIACLGIIFSVWMLSTRSFAQAGMLAAVIGLGVVIWFAMRRPGAGVLRD
jgi:APA family basic amino acid/polyamine antiporter